MMTPESRRPLIATFRRAKSSLKANVERCGQAPRGAAKSVSFMDRTTARAVRVTLTGKRENSCLTQGRRGFKEVV